MGLIQNISNNRNSFLKSRFLERVTSKAFENIIAEQDTVIQENELVSKGLITNLDKRRFYINVEGEGVTGSITVPKRMRFIDMKKLRGKKNLDQAPIYNRTIFGTIYGSYIPELRFGFTDSVKQQLAQEYKIEL